jgi:hypothetical protein
VGQEGPRGYEESDVCWMLDEPGWIEVKAPAPAPALSLALALGRNIAVYVLGQHSALLLFFLSLLSEICAELGRTKNACLWDFLSRGGLAGIWGSVVVGVGVGVCG